MAGTTLAEEACLPRFSLGLGTERCSEIYDLSSLAMFDRSGRLNMLVSSTC